MLDFKDSPSGQYPRANDELSWDLVDQEGNDYVAYDAVDRSRQKPNHSTDGSRHLNLLEKKSRVVQDRLEESAKPVIVG
jgi:hypothetical protein